jgi:hypothetical protein
MIAKEFVQEIKNRLITVPEDLFQIRLTQTLLSLSVLHPSPGFIPFS